MSKRRLKIFSEGIFHSILNYCLPLFRHIFVVDRYRDTITKEDNRKLKELQNYVMKLIDYDDRHQQSGRTSQECLQHQDRLCPPPAVQQPANEPLRTEDFILTFKEN